MDKFYEIWEPVLKSFKNHFPDLYDEMVDWYPYGHLEIAIKLRNGKRIFYDMMDDLIGPINEFDDNVEEDIDEIAWRNNFSSRLINKMRKVGIGQEILSDRSGISRVTLSKYMNGKASPSGYNLERLARALRCSISELTSIRQ